MTAAARRASITKFFANGWNSLTPVAYDDVVDDNIPPNPPATWARLTIKHFTGEQVSVGSPGANLFRKEGIINVQIFAPANNNAQDAVAKGDAVVALFQGKPRFEGVDFSNVRMNEVGPDGAGWFQVNVKIDFEYDDLA